MQNFETLRTKLRNGHLSQKQRYFVISILLLPLKTEETTCGGNTERHPDRKLTLPDTLQRPRLPSPASQFISMSFAAITSHWGMEETTTSSPTMVGQLASQSNQNKESQILSLHEDQRSGKIRISLAREKPIKDREDQERRGGKENKGNRGFLLERRKKQKTEEKKRVHRRRKIQTKKILQGTKHRRENEREREREPKGAERQEKTNRGEDTEDRRRTPATSIHTILRAKLQQQVSFHCFPSLAV